MVNSIYLFVLLLFNFTVESSHINKTFNFILNNKIPFTIPKNFKNFNIVKRNLLNSDDEDNDSVIYDSNEIKNSQITITNNQEEIKINEELLLEASKVYRSQLELDDFMLDIFIEDERAMKTVNFEQFGKDKPTDIISLRDELKHTKTNYYLNRTPYKNRDHYHLGEIFLCPQYIKSISDKEDFDRSKTTKQILKTKKSGGVAERLQGIRDVDVRMCLLLAHGILHLIGYDHETEEDYNEMIQMEDSLLDVMVYKLVEKIN